MELSGYDFEDEVRRVARELWPSSEFSGATIVDGRERDGIFETEWVTHLIEATSSRSKAKAEADISKLVKLRNRSKGRDKTVQCWFVTQHEPTADQRSVAPKDGSVKVVSFEQFRSQLVDAHGYLRDREKYAFGSARDPDSGSLDVKEAYVPLSALSTSGDVVAASDLSESAAEGGRIIVLGDFGAGKSMTLREIHRGLRNSFNALRSPAFPLHLNLRDHHAQRDPAEALVRHARNIGFPHPNQLIRAWRAGYAHLLLDGFDEMASPGWIGSSARMRQIRRRSVELVRKFIQETPQSVGIVIAGREHYFDSQVELREALAPSTAFSQYSLTGFSDEQVRTYLERHGYTALLPEWLPSRPLLIAYLVSRDLLAAAISIPAGSAPAMAWDHLLELICTREADIEGNIDGHAVRRVVERLASIARSRPDGLGPLEFSDIDAAFREVTGSTPDDRAVVLLQRLPGLGPMDQETGERRFVDTELADAARAGDVTKFATNPFVEAIPSADAWTTPMGALGIEVGAYQLANIGEPGSKLVAAARHSSSNGSSNAALTVDLVRIAAELAVELSQGKPIRVEGLLLDNLDLSEPRLKLSIVEFHDCVIENLEIPREGIEDISTPRFYRCHFGCIEGRSSEQDLPPGRFIDCSFDIFDEAGVTTSQLRATSLPAGQRVALTILKKLYFQRGTGRKEGGLSRGLPQDERTLVPGVLSHLDRSGLALSTTSGKQTIWLPVRKARSRVRGMIDAPTNCTDEAWTSLATMR